MVGRLLPWALFGVQKPVPSHSGTFVGFGFDDSRHLRAGGADERRELLRRGLNQTDDLATQDLDGRQVCHDFQVRRLQTLAAQVAKLHLRLFKLGGKVLERLG